jgi:phenylalanyl-tRNA synthetase beta chain
VRPASGGRPPAGLHGRCRQGEPLQIVCGAPERAPGLKAPLATGRCGAAGRRTRDQGGEAARRRVQRHALLGPRTRPRRGRLRPAGAAADAPVGAPLADYLGLPDARIEIKLTPNRADCFSMRGIAFDVAAATGSEVERFGHPDAPRSTTRSCRSNSMPAADARATSAASSRVSTCARTPAVDGRAPAPQRHPPDQPRWSTSPST